MKKLILAFVLLIIPHSVSASESTHYLSKIYSVQYKSGVEIISTKEYIDRYEQKVGEIMVPSVVYGIGYMRIGKNKKTKISYVCLYNINAKPFWGYVIPR